MSFHGSGIDEETYDTLRAYMFGDLNPYKGWTKEELAHPEEFVEWVIEECDWEADLLELTEEEVRELAAIVFDHELEEWKEVEE